MKNSWIALALGLIVVFSSFTIAAVPNVAVSLNGVRPGDNIQVAKDKFGSYSVRGDEFYFSNGVVVEVDKRNPDMIEELTTRESNVATPAGVSVGMSENVLTKHYGTADKVDYDDGEVEYKYYSADGKSKIVFKVRGGAIQKIHCELH